MKILSVVGTRPNFMKVAPIIKALDRKRPLFQHTLVHTGQHYDERMSASFFEDLKMPKPDFELGVGSGSHAQQTAAVMTKIEPVLLGIMPDLVIVVGDVNSTLACALTARKLNLTVAHVEAGLRSFDMTMPEEINRLCTDTISDILFTTDVLANENLYREGAAKDKVHFVGNVMIDSLLSQIKVAERLAFHNTLGVQPGSYATLTLHRPSNVDDATKLTEIIDTISAAMPDILVVFPIHPRTRKRVDEFGLTGRFTDSPAKPGIFLVEPLGYLEFLSLNQRARLVLTDSGGLQEETTILGIPCVTLRENTERPITVTDGTNRLAGTTRSGIMSAIKEALSSKTGSARHPEKWDGHAAERIVDVIVEQFLQL